MIKRALLALALIIAGSVGSAATFAPSSTYAACDVNGGKILTIRPWYHGLVKDVNGKCEIKSPTEMGGIQPFITRIVLNAVEILLQIVGYIAFGFMVYGGFIYLTSSGAPDRAAKGQKTVLNAAIGLFVAIASIGLVNFVGGALGL